MLPDFIKAKKEAQKSLTTFFRAVVESEPLVANISRRTVSEGDKMTTGDDTGDTSTSEFTRVAAEMSVLREDIIAKGVGAYLETLKKPAEEMQAQQAKMIIEGLNAATEKTGNKVEAEGRAFDFDIFLEAISKVEIRFTPDGQAQLPSLFIHPDMAARVAELAKEWDAEPEYKRRMDEVIAQKKVDWDARESHRRLVD